MPSIFYYRFFVKGFLYYILDCHLSLAPATSVIVFHVFIDFQPVLLQNNVGIDHERVRSSSSHLYESQAICANERLRPWT